MGIGLDQIVEFVVGLFFWWIAIYVVSQNFFSRLNQLFFVLLAAASIYLSTDILYTVAELANQNYLVVYLLKAVVWTVYLPIALYYHISYLLTKSDDRQPWQRYFLFVSYFFAAVSIFLDTFTSLTRDYKMIGLTGDTVSFIGRYLWLNGVLQWAIILATALNFYRLLKNQPKRTDSWYKFLWPLCGLIVLLFLIPVVVLGYYNFIPHPSDLLVILVTLVILALVYSVIRYDLIIADTKLIFGKRFMLSSLVTLLVLAIYMLTLWSSTIKFETVQSFIFPYILIYLVIASHPLHNWLSTFIADLTYNISSGFSVVNDHEISESLRNYHRPLELESSPLLRLRLVANKIKAKEASTPVDALRQIVSEAVEYYKPVEEKHRRIKDNLIYYYLKMMAFDRAEEGQILWELGFGEYPASIIRTESRSRLPLFKTNAISDYPYTSRNAFMALRKEALHAVAWRVSYLEKLNRK